MRNHHRSAIHIPARRGALTGCFSQRASQVAVFVGVLIAALAGVEANAQPREDMLSFVTDGQGSATIVIPETPDFWTEGAKWLAEYVHKASGAELKIVREEKGQTLAGPIISVGATAMAANAGVDTRGLKWDDCRLIVKGDVLYLLGRDDAGTRTHNWVGARGTCRAVIRFLEDVCQVRWFLPGPQGEFVPATRNIHVPRTVPSR